MRFDGEHFRTGRGVRKQIMAGLALITAVAGCLRSERAAPDDLRGVRRAEHSLAAARNVRPADVPPVLADGVQLTWEELVPRLNEAAGALIIEELLLDRLIRTRLVREQFVITPEDVAREQDLLANTMAESLGRGASTPRADRDGTAALETIRARRGLGPERFAATLERTAGLRKLVARSIIIDQNEVNRAIEIRFGAKVIARVLLVTTQSEAAMLRTRLLEPGLSRAERSALFAEVARERSSDPSAAAGGLIGPASPADPVFPSTLRAAWREQSEGEVGPVIVLREGFALTLVESRIAAAAPPEGADSAARDDLRLAKERVAMDALAEQLLAEVRVTVFEPGLRWSWDQRNKRRELPLVR